MSRYARRSLVSTVVVGLLAAGMVAGAGEVIVSDLEPNDPGQWINGEWHVANERDGAVSTISTVQPRSGDGSADQSLPAPSGNSPKTDVEVFSTDTTFVSGEGVKALGGGFGLLSDLDANSFDWYRDSSSTAPDHLTPALRLYVWDPDVGVHGASYLMIWEGIYNGYPAASGPVPTDQWVAEDIAGEFFWRVPQFIDGAFGGIGFCNSNPTECFVFDNTLSDWGLGPNTVVYGVNVGLGSGWAGSYQGYADNVTIGFSGDPMATTWNFEPPPPVPAVGAIGLLALITGLMIALLRDMRRRTEERPDPV